MKRAPWYVLAGALAGFAGVLGLHGRPASQAALSLPGGGTAGVGQRQGTPSSQPTGQPSPQPTGRPSSPAGSGAGTVRTVTGALEQYGYGELNVRVTVRGSEIIGVSVPTLRVADPFSRQVADQALPVLRSQVLSSHGTSISAVSGATYTSQAYANSLQSALDKLGVK